MRRYCSGGCRLAALLPVLGLLALLSATPGLAQAKRSVAEVTVLTGEATVTRFRGGEPDPLDVGDALSEGDRIRTAAGSKLGLELVDGSRLQLGAGTELTLEWILHAPALDAQNVLLTMSAGIVRTVVDTMLGLANFQLQTTTAVTAVRGTDWIVEATPASSAVIALAGEVAVGTLGAGFRGEVVLGPGEGTTVAAGEEPSEPATWNQARRDAFIARTALATP